MIGAVFDLEATGLEDHMIRDPDSRIHCLMLKEFTVDQDGQMVPGLCREYYDVATVEPDDSQWIHAGPIHNFTFDLATRYRCVVGHNIIFYDIPVLEHKIQADFSSTQIVDSLVLSRKNWPDRPDGHSVEAWGSRLGQQKMAIAEEEWAEFTPRIVERCRGDVEIEFEIFLKVMAEMAANVEKCNG